MTIQTKHYPVYKRTLLMRENCQGEAIVESNQPGHWNKLYRIITLKGWLGLFENKFCQVIVLIISHLISINDIVGCH